MNEDYESLQRRVSLLGEERERHLIVEEALREEVRKLAEERDALLGRCKDHVIGLTCARARILTLEVELGTLRQRRPREAKQDVAAGPSALAEELQATVEELQVTAEQLAIANGTLRTQNETLEQRVDERTTALRDANRVLQRNQDLLRYAQQCAGAGTWEWDIEGEGASGSPEYFQLLGLDPADGMPTMEGWIASLHPDDRQEAGRALDKVLSSPEQDEFLTEFRTHHPGLGERWIMGRGRVTRRNGRRATHMTGLFIDITKQKQLEHALREAVTVADRANHDKTRFIAAASHDLRQPIQAASLYLGLLGHHIQDEGTRTLLDLLQASIDGLHGMLDGLLDLSRLEAGVIEPKIAAFRPDELMARLASEFQAQAETKGVKLHVRPCRQPVFSDPHLLERILRNLLANAMTHTGKGGVLLACRRRGEHAEFQIWDTGPGIPEEQRQVIFEDFRQLHNPERNSAQGFGLGLAIVRRLSRLLGLTVTLRSVVGRGSVFSVLVPLAGAVEPAGPDSDSASDRMAALRRHRGRTVLVVEDDRAVRRAIVMLLENWGFNVVSSADRDELADLLEHIEETPSALISDYRLPGGQTGRSIVDLVRGRWDVPAIIITADTTPDRLREASAAGCRLLHKPVEPARLASVLDEVILD